MTADDQVFAAIERVNQMTADLATIKDVTVLVEGRDKIETIRRFLRLRKADLELQNWAVVARIKHERAIAERLKQMQEDGDLITNGGDRRSVSHRETLKTLEDLGIHRRNDHRWRQFVGLDDLQLEGLCHQATSDGEELTTKAVLRHERPDDDVTTRGVDRRPRVPADAEAWEANRVCPQCGRHVDSLVSVEIYERIRLERERDPEAMPGTTAKPMFRRDANDAR